MYTRIWFRAWQIMYQVSVCVCVCVCVVSFNSPDFMFDAIFIQIISVRLSCCATEKMFQDNNFVLLFFLLGFCLFFFSFVVDRYRSTLTSSQDTDRFLCRFFLLLFVGRRCCFCPQILTRRVDLFDSFFILLFLLDTTLRLAL